MSAAKCIDTAMWPWWLVHTAYSHLPRPLPRGRIMHCTLSVVRTSVIWLRFYRSRRAI